MRHCTMTLLAVLAVMVITSSTHAQNNKYRYPPAVSHAGSAKARADIAKAEVDLKKAKDGFAVIGGTLRKDLENSAEWKGAQATVKQAQADFNGSRDVVIKQINEKPDYKTALQRKEDAEKQRDALGEDAGINKKAEAALAVLNSGKAVTEMESAAIAADPKASQAKKNLTEAADKLAAIEKQFEETMKQNPKYTAAKKAVDDAEKKLATAKADLATATQKEAKAEADRQKRIDQIERQRAADRRRWYR